MFDLKLNLEPGNADGHTVLRFLVEEKQMPLPVAIERVYKAVAKYAQEYRADQGKLVGTMAITGILGAGIAFPVGVPTVMLLVSAGATIARWMELGAMRERLKPEYYTLKQSVLLEQFVKWLAKELKERHQQEFSSGGFQTDAITTTNVLTAYEDTVFAVSNGEHLDNNASDPILALFVAKLRQHTNHLPDWVIQAFKQLEHAEVQRSKDLQQVHQYMWGDLGQTPTLLAAPSSKPVGENPGVVEVPAVPSLPETEDEQRLGKPVENLMEPVLNTTDTKAPIVLFDFSSLRSEPDKYAHLRVIGGTGIGKTLFVDWLLDVLGGERFVVTPKKKSWNWRGITVYGLWFDYATIRTKLEWIHSEMYRRFPLMEAGQNFELTNFVVDEWRLINMNVKAIKEKDESGILVEVAPSAKAMMKDIITVSREAMLRLIALAQGEQVQTWGFEGESDLEECFTDIRLGDLAIDYARSLRGQCRKDSEEYHYWTAVLSELEWQDSRRTSEGKAIPCCMVGRYPARIPDLSRWKREGVEDIEEFPPTEEPVSSPEPERVVQKNLDSDIRNSSESEPTTELKVSDDLAEPLKSIWLFAKKKNDWVTAKDIYKNGMSALKGKSVKNIRQYLGLLADGGYGSIDEMDGDKPKSDSAVGFRAY